MMSGYERKVWEAVGGIQTHSLGKAHLISGDSHWRRQTLVRHLYFEESSELLSIHQEDKVQLFKSEPRRGERNSNAGKDGGNKIHWGKRNSWGAAFLKTQQTDDFSQEMEGQNGAFKFMVEKILNLCISSGVRSIYVYLSSLS